MRLGKALYAAMVGAIATGTVLALPAASAMATTSAACDYSPSTTMLCMSANGTVGDYVLGKTYSTNNQEDTIAIFQSGTCFYGTVESTWYPYDQPKNCPFTDAALDYKYQNDPIYAYYNPKESVYYLGSNVAGGVIQGSTAGSGHEWVAVMNSKAQNEMINVNVSDTNGADYHLCADGLDQPLVVTSSWLGNGSCMW